MPNLLGNVFALSFSAVTASAGADKELFDVVASTSSRFKLTSLTITKSTIGSTEGVPIQVWRGSTLASSTGTILVPTRYDGRSSATATFFALGNSTTTGSSGASAQLLMADALNDYHPFVWQPYRDGTYDDRPIFGTVGTSAGVGERLQVRLKAPGGNMQINANLVLEEIGLV